MAGAKPGIRTRFLSESPAGSGNFVAAAEVRSVGGIALQRDALDATHMESPDAFAEYVPGVGSGGDLDLVLQFRPDHASQGTSVNGQLYDFVNAVVKKYRVEWPQFPNTPTVTVTGFYTAFTIQTATRDLITVSAKIKSTGKPEFLNFA